MRLLAAALLAAWLAGCATAPAPLPGVSPQQYRELLQLQDWQIRGKLAVAAPGARESALLDWRQRGERYDITLAGPFGGGKVRLQGDATRVSFQRAGEPPQVAADPESILQQQLGWSVPVRELRHWARGLPSPRLPVEHSQSQNGVLTALQQDGWQLEFSQHRAVSGLPLPGRIVARRGDIKLTLVAREWSL